MGSVKCGLIIINVVVLALVAQMASASPLISQTNTRYPVTGNTPAELHAQMDIQGPVVEGRHYNASTEYFVRWNMEYRQDEQGCKPTGANITLFITQMLPEWQNYATASLEGKQNWDVYIDRLKQHEAGHVDHGIQAANEVEAMFASLPTMASCTLLERAAKGKTDAIVDRYKSIDVAYDGSTSHGMTQRFV